jgi:hypothetical protein
LEFLVLEQPWYADDAGVAGKFDDIRRLFVKLQETGPDLGYFPEPSKSILIMPELSVAQAEITLEGLKFHISTRSRYLGGFIGEDVVFDSWVEEKTQKLAGAVDELALAAKNFPQAAYSGLQTSLQQEWQFLQQVQ